MSEIAPPDAETARRRLATAPWRQRPGLVKIFERLDAAQGRTRLVGGVVRDTILGRAGIGTDVDAATELTPDEVIDRAARAGITHFATGLAHGTVTLRARGDVVEITTLRRDVATDGRHAVVAFGTDWAEDAARRDFTMNALYADMDGTLFDPLGGLGDCLAGRVRFIGNPHRRIAEDGLRVFRLFRFSATHGHQVLDPEGLAACRLAVGRLGHISAERVGAEMRRLLSAPRCAGVLAAMAHCGLLNLAPATLKALGRLDDLERDHLAARGSLIAADLGLERLANHWRLSRSEVAAWRDVDRAARSLAEGHIDAARYGSAAAIPAALSVAAARLGWTSEERASVEKIALRPHPGAMPVTGDDLLALGMEKGPRLGAILDQLEQDWIESGFTLGRQDLLARVER